MRRGLGALAASCALISGLAGSLWSQSLPFGSAQLVIEGNRLTLFEDELTTDALQTINVAEPVRVRTCFGASTTACGSVQAGDPRIAGLKVQAELRGPELVEPVPFETVPGGTFLLPGFQQPGDYFLENVRLVSTATGQVLGFASPSLAVLQVREIVLARASVRQLTLAELQAQGVTLNEENFQAFNFAVGFALEGEVFEIEFPVVFNGAGGVEMLPAKPRVVLDQLPPITRDAIRRWQPPNIIPFRLEGDRDEQQRLKAPGEPTLGFPVFGAIVIPGTVTYLNQFFDAQLIVANGAPAGSDAMLGSLHGALRLPGGQVMRLAKTDPPVAPGQLVPVLRGDGSRILASGEEGTASWIVEGLVAGTHTLDMEITGELLRPGRDPLPLVSRTQAAVEVVDARFNLTFSHPETVREGEAYTLFVTVTNLSQAIQNLITVDIREQSLTGAHPEDSADTLSRTIETLQPGQAETLEYRLVSEVDGKVIATTFQSTSSAGQGTIELRAGVGELGIPLSPATLILPRFSDRLGPPHLPDDELVRANVRLLGLAYSLAVAPAGRTPPGLPRVIKSDVERRAVDLAEAGQRTFLQEQLLESLEVLALDQLGNRHTLGEFDELRRLTTKGLRAASQLAVRFRAEQQSRDLDALELLDHFAETTSYAPPYLAATVVPTTSGPAPQLELYSVTGAGALVGVSDDELAAVRGLPYGEMYAIRRTAASTETVPLALVGHLELADELQIVLRNDSASSASGRLVVIVPDGDSGDYRRVDLGSITVPSLTGVAVRVGPGVADVGAGGFRFFDVDSGLELASAPIAMQQAVPLPPFRIIGAVQDFRLAEEGPDKFGNYIRPNRYGNALSYLFNRPPDRAAAEQASSYRIRSTFIGFDTEGQSVSRVSEKVGVAAFFQENSERVVHVRYDKGIAAMLDLDGTPLLQHEDLSDVGAIVDPRGNPLSSVPPVVLETVPQHVGGLIEGRVVSGTGEGVAGALVQLVRQRLFKTFGDPKIRLDLAGEVTTGPDGGFYFDFVEGPHWDPDVLKAYVLRATVPPGPDPELEPAQVQQVSSFIRQQNLLTRINIALLGRGTISGIFVDRETQAPISQGTVTAASTLFNEQKTVTTDVDGSFRLPGMPVGPITLTGRTQSGGRRVYATVVIERPGQLVDVRLELEPLAPARGTGSVSGRVLQRLEESGGVELATVEGATVEVYSEGNLVHLLRTDSLGRYFADNVPEGQVSLQAHADISRAPAFVDLLLAAGGSEEVDLVLSGGTRTVSGRVLFREPLSQTLTPIEGAVAFISGPGVFAYTDSEGRYRIENVPLQGSGGSSYGLTAIDFTRKLEGSVALPPITEVSPDEILAQDIVLEQMRGGIDGVVLDPLGRPAPGVAVEIPLFGSTTTGSDGSFSFDNVGLGGVGLVAHIGDGLVSGQVGYFASTKVDVLFGGHRPFATLRMRGSGIVNIHASTSSATGILTPIFYRQVKYDAGSKSIVLNPAYVETTTDQNGDLQIEVPVGALELVAFNPFHGVIERKEKVDFPGQIKNIEILFADASIVTGQVLDVDGITPVVNIPVTLRAKGLLPQTLRSDALGRFQFELVPPGGFSVAVAGVVGTVERVGITYGSITLPGQTVDVTVQLKAQGTVRGQVLEDVGSGLVPLAGAQVFVRESSYPYRRLPEAEGTFYIADTNGRYEVSHVFAGPVSVVARDPLQVTRKGRSFGTITSDFQVVEMPDIVMSTSVGSLGVVVRDSETGAAVPDAVVRLSNGETTVTGPSGSVEFSALPLGNYSVYAFYAPTGRSGRTSGLVLAQAGQSLSSAVFLEQRGEIRGTLYDDEALLQPVGNGIVRLQGSTTIGRFTALATTSGAPELLGRFFFQGVPVGEFELAAGLEGSVRRAGASVAITETSPLADVNLVFEPVGDVYLRLYERLSTGTSLVDPALNIVGVRMKQTGYDFTRAAPEASTDTYFFPTALAERGASFTAQEVGGEQRQASASVSELFVPVSSADGTGTAADPYQLVLKPKGTVSVTVLDAQSQPVAGAPLTVYASGAKFPTVTGPDGSVTFFGVPAGNITASATSPTTGLGGVAKGVLTFDDEVLLLTVNLAPSVSAHGIIFAPLPDDRLTGDPSELVPAVAAVVQLTDGRGVTQLVLTEADGTYRFEGLGTGGFLLEAQNQNGDQMASIAGTLSGPDGNDNALPDLILDGSPPRILSISPPPGLEGVSRTAPVEILFSEPLLATVLPSGPTSSFFALRSTSGTLAAGTWSSALEGGAQVVRFVPAEPYDNFTTYSLVIKGGPNGVKDRVGRLLTLSGDVGTNFTTSDTIGPTVIGTIPSLDLPVDPDGSIRVDFSEGVVATPQQLDGLGGDDAAQILARRNDGTQVALPLTLFLTRGNFSLQVSPVLGFVVSDDSGERTLIVSGLEDSIGNVMPVFEKTYRIFDETPPSIVEVPFPEGAPDGNLRAGATYSLTPVLSSVDGVTPENPGGDVARLEYFFVDPTEPINIARPPDVAAEEYPFSFSFVGAYGGNGIDPDPFPVWVRAVDTSQNTSNVVFVGMQVLPNGAPTLDSVTVTALEPVAGTFYAGSLIEAEVSGFADDDGNQLTVSAELFQDGVTEPLAAVAGRTVQQPAGGWGEAAPELFEFTLDLTLAEGASLFVRGRAVDSQGATVTSDSAPFLVADDAEAPRIVSVVARRQDGVAETTFFINQSFRVEVQVEDLETAVQMDQVEVSFDSLFATATAVAVAGSPGLYRTPLFTVPVVPTTATIAATVTAPDYGGNSATGSLTFQVSPEPDPTAPTAEWLTPWPAAPWPAAYTSVTDPAAGVPFLLRAEVIDFNEDATGAMVPGELAEVSFRGPVRDANGDIVLAETFTPAALVAGTGGPGRGVYELLWQIPNQIAAGDELPFAVRATDTGSLSVERLVTMTAQPYRKVYEQVVTAITPEDPMLQDPDGDPAGLVFLLNGTTLSLFPANSGVRQLPGVVLWSGGETVGTPVLHPSVLTAPEITSLASAILYYPLELSVSDLLALGAASRVDLRGRGLLGNTTEESVALPGESAAAPRAGGSHGGSGWFGSPSGGWARTDLNQPGSVYGNVRDPQLPGSGGGGASTTSPGGNGGGVFRLFASGASVHLAGDVDVRGGDGAGGSGGGAGGSVRIEVDRLEGTGVIDTSGGHGADAGRSGGGGGGRVSIAYRELAPEVDLALQIRAEGGNNRASNPASAQRLAGAGTVFLEAVDPVAGATGIGELRLTNGTLPLPAAITPLPALGSGELSDVDPVAGTVLLDVPGTRGDVAGDTVLFERSTGELVAALGILDQVRVADPTAVAGFLLELLVDATESELDALAAELGSSPPILVHGRSRYGSVAIAGRARVVADDDLEIGAAGEPTPALNDRAAVLFDAEGRLLLRGEGPTLNATAVPDNGSDLRLGSTIEVSFTADDPLGFASSTETFSLLSSPTLRLFEDERLSVVPTTDPLLLDVPVTTAPGPATFTVDVTDLGGRTTSADFSWTVLANADPTGSVSGPPSVKAGATFTVVVHAEDPEGLAEVELQASGPVNEPLQTVTTSGTMQDLTFTLSVPATADGSTPIVVEAVITDIIDTSVTTAPLTIPVLPNDLPTGTVSLEAGFPAVIKPDQSTQVLVHGEDPDGVATVELVAVGDVTEASQMASVSGTAVDVSFTLTAQSMATPGPLTVTARITDTAGATFETAPLGLEIIDNALPTGTLVFAPGTPTSVLPGTQVSVQVHAEDEEGLREIELAATGPVAAPTQTQAITGTVADVTFDVVVERTAVPSDTVSLVARIFDEFGHPATLTETLNLVILEDTDTPQVTVEGVRPTYYAGQELEAVVTIDDSVGASELQITFDGSTQTFTDPGSVFRFSTEIDRTLVTGRSTSFDVVATDFAGHTSTPSQTPVQLLPDVAPSVSVAVPSGTQLLPGAVLDVEVTASDDVQVDTMTFTLSGALSERLVRPVGTSQTTEAFRRQLPIDFLGGETIHLEIDVEDSFGHVETRTVDFTVLADAEQPAVSIDFLPASDGDVYLSGEAITLVATAQDNVAVSNLTMTVNGETVSGSSPLVHVFTAPTVTTATPFEVTADALDPSGNSGTASRTLNVEPLANGGIPTIEFDCPTTGATLPSAYAVALSVTATDDLGVAQVDFYRDDETVPFATIMPAAGTETSFVAQTMAVLPTVAGTEQIVRFRAVASDASTNTAETEIEVRVVEAVDLDPAGANDWASLTTQTVVLRSGTLVVDEPRTVAGLIVLPGATITHTASSPAAQTGLDLTVNGRLYVACGGAVDATARGFAANETYPGETPPGPESGGSHLGVGGLDGQPPASTFGSITRPQESGGGGQSSGRGGGVVRLRSTSLMVDGAVRANGESANRGGAGGSVWVTTESLSGGGVVEANGGTGADFRGGGGGGAVALEYTSASGSVLSQLSAGGGAATAGGGAGTVYTFGPSSIYGDVLLDNGPISGRTELPSLGDGVAQPGSAGLTLVTDRAEAIPAFFVGHWVEISSAMGSVEGIARVESVSGVTAILAAEPGQTLSVEPGDRWQGVYRFDDLVMQGGVFIDSADPVRVSGEQEISGDTEASQIYAGNLRLRTGSTLRSSSTSAGGSAEILQIELTGDLVIEPGASIDVSARGYPLNQSYPGETTPGPESGGSHLGVGGLDGAPVGSTFGSVTRPQEGGGGGQSTSGGRGGGAVRIVAANVVLVDATSAVRANGQSANRGGAGGSVWITADGLSGEGVIEANGGNGADFRGAGGGGAIAIEYASTSGSVLANVRAYGGVATSSGGAGTVYERGPSSVYGDLIVDNGPVVGQRTVLPALGSGVAQAGSGGLTLVTDRLQAIPQFFIGHWVEISSSTGSFKGWARVASVNGPTAELELEPGQSLSVELGDRWQGVYRFDNLSTGGAVFVDSADPIRVSGQQEISGEAEASEIFAGSLRIRSGATLRSASSSAGGLAETLRIELTGDLVIEPGASIDVSERGYPQNQTYPGESTPGPETGGSHLGYGGLDGAPLGSTFGSVTRPREGGGGGQSSGRGGGAVRIVAGNVVLVDATSAIRANGQSANRGGAGGSVWLTTDGLSGEGVIEANGGNGADFRGAGGGGAIAIEYTSTSGSVLSNVRAYGGSATSSGGAGTVYALGPSSLLGDLIVDGGPVVGQRTELPSFGSGMAQPGSGGLTLVTDRAESIPQFFVGHWVEVSSATGVFEGYARIASVNGMTAELETESAQSLSVEPGDRWQGVYRFDNVTARGTVFIDSADPIRATGEHEIAGDVEMSHVIGGDLTIRSGATLRSSAASAGGSAETLQIELSGNLLIEPGGAIDVTGRGFQPNQTYPGETPPGGESGGSHLGYGGLDAQPRGSTFGSVTRPLEGGGGGQSSGRGGGTVRIVAANVVLEDATSVIRANGQSANRGGAAGSVWITTGGLLGEGLIEASGGTGADFRGAGGGGAIAIEYTSTSGTVRVQAYGGTASSNGGAGTVYELGPSSVFGDLIVDGGPVVGEHTELPSLGSGIAQSGSGGLTLVTDRSDPVPEFFVGHWVEISSAAGTFEGFARVASVQGMTVELEVESGSLLSVEPGDRWQGVYRFDNVATGGRVWVDSADPIRVTGEHRIGGEADLKEVTGTNLTILPGAILHSSATSSPGSSETLRIELSGDLVIEAGGAIDVTGRGFFPNQTYPGETPPGGETGGSHLGYGGLDAQPRGSTFGSVTRPQEGGGGGQSSGRGGGAVRIVAANVVLVDTASVIRANGEAANRGGAGGSVWISADGLAGEGSIEASGGNAADFRGAGGGGAIAIEYTSTSGAVLSNLRAYGGTATANGGAGTVLVVGPTQTYGDLLVDNNGVTGEATKLPPLGSGVAQLGTVDNRLVTDRVTEIPAYFEGHWVRVRASDGTLKGIFPIGAVDGFEAELEGAGLSLVEGDLWEGVYRFDTVTVQGAATFESDDVVLEGGQNSVSGSDEESSRGGEPEAEGPTSSSAVGPAGETPQSAAASWIDSTRVQIAIGEIAGSYRIDIDALAVAHVPGLVSLRLSDDTSRLEVSWSPDAGATLYWPGRPGQQLRLFALGEAGVALALEPLALPALPDGGWDVPTYDLPAGERPQLVVAGDTWLGVADRTVRVFDSRSGALLAEVQAKTAADRALRLAATDDVLVIGRRDRLELVALPIRDDGFREVLLGEGEALVDLVVSSGAAVALVNRPDGSGGRSMALRRLQLGPSLGGVELSEPSEGLLGGARLERAQLFAIGDSLNVLATPETDALKAQRNSRAWDLLMSVSSSLSSAAIWEVEPEWRVAGTWGRGLVLARGSVARLLEVGPLGQWTEVSRFEADEDILSAAGRGDRLVLALRGEIWTLDVNDPLRPQAVARFAGSAHRQVQLSHQLLVGSPGFDSFPVVLDLEAAAAASGTDGFVPLIDGVLDVP